MSSLSSRSVASFSKEYFHWINAAVQATPNAAEEPSPAPTGKSLDRTVMVIVLQTVVVFAVVLQVGTTTNRFIGPNCANKYKTGSMACTVCVSILVPFGVVVWWEELCGGGGCCCGTKCCIINDSNNAVHCGVGGHESRC